MWMLMECLLLVGSRVKGVLSAIASLLDRFGNVLRDMAAEGNTQKVSRVKVLESSFVRWRRRFIWVIPYGIVLAPPLS